MTQTDQQNVPKLRFPGFNSAWERFAINEIIRGYRLGGNYENSETPTDKPLIKMGNLRRGSMDVSRLEYVPAEVKVDPKDRISEGDLFFNTRNTLDLVGKVAIWRNELPTAYYNSNLLKIDFDDTEFMNYRFNDSKGLKALKRIASGTTSVAAIYTKDFLKVKLQLPTLPEQRKIAGFLGVVDTKIAQLAEKKRLLEDYKKGCMQRLFSQKNRFKDDTGNDFPDWEEKRLGEVATFSKGKGISKADIAEDGATPCIRYGEIYTLYREHITEVRSSTDVSRDSLYLSQSQDVIIPASGEDPLDMARACCVEDAGIALGGDINILRGAPNGVFLAYYLNNAKRKEIARYAQGNSVVHLYASKMRNLSVSLPHQDEQCKIADFLSALDRKIDLVCQELDHARTFKRGLLQQMFV